MFKGQKGITLVALVITIIVLLILAGISISLVVGQNGVLIQASNSVEENAAGGARQAVDLAIASCEADFWAAWAKNSQTTRGQYYLGVEDQSRPIWVGSDSFSQDKIKTSSGSAEDGSQVLATTAVDFTDESVNIDLEEKTPFYNYLLSQGYQLVKSGSVIVPDTDTEHTEKGIQYTTLGFSNIYTVIDSAGGKSVYGGRTINISKTCEDGKAEGPTSYIDSRLATNKTYPLQVVVIETSSKTEVTVYLDMADNVAKSSKAVVNKVQR